MAKVLISTIFDPVTPEGPSDQFKAITSDMDAQSWRGRGSTFELPNGGKYGAGGNTDGDDTHDPPLNQALSGSFKIAGPADVSSKGNTAIGGKR